MLKKLKMSHFAQHVDRTVEFTPGLNAIRGHNRAGKSNTLRAISYALFGSAGLDKPFDRVVTRGAAPSKLRVELDFEHLGIEYHVYRAKSGAELTFGNERVTGQNEVTAAIEALFKADAKMAGQLMIAGQKKMAGEMTKGSVGAARLIETLADFNLLDRIKDLIQSELPCGGTTGVEGRIALLTEQAAEPELTDLAPLQAAVQAADEACQRGAVTLAAEQRRVADLEAKESARILSDLVHARGREERAEAARAAASARLEEKAPDAPSDKQMQKLIDAHEASKRQTAALVLLCDLQSASTEMLWDEPREALDAEIVAARGRLEALNARAAEEALNSRRISGNNRTRDLQEAIKLVQMKIIKDNTCAFCQKDLTDVPEVVKINAGAAREVSVLEDQLVLYKTTLNADLENLQKTLDNINEEIKGQLDECRALENVVKVADKLAPLYAKAHEYIELDESVVPAQWKWTGPTSGSTAAAEARFAADAQRQALQEFNGRRAEAERALAAAEAELVEARVQLAPLANKEEQALVDLEALKAARILASQLSDEQLALSGASLRAQRALTDAKSQNANLANQVAAAKEQLAAAHAELLEMQANNALVKKVAAARPTITDKLWGMVLGAASGYLSRMLGEPCAVTRDDGEFLINGAPAADASGAEEDCFGLSIRVALTRTFIPTASFLILDEPAAACDEAREMAMLGQIATLGFDQTILITHSDLCESFANNLIVIE